MPQSEILELGARQIKQSLILRWIIKQVDIREDLNYSSVIASSFNKPILKINYVFDYFLARSYIKSLLGRIDLKSVVLFLFIVAQVIFPGYGTENTGGTLLPGSPAGSIANRYGFLLNLLIFGITLVGLVFVFIKDLAKQRKTLSVSRFEIFLLLFLISLEVSTLFSTYISISSLWLIKVLRGFLVYLIFSRLILNKKNLFFISFAFLSVIYIESIIALLQYFSGGFLGLPIETATNVASSTQLFQLLNNTAVFRPTGTLSQSNILSFILSFSLPFGLILTFSKYKLAKALAFGSILISLVASLMTLSRWGTITLFFSLGTLLFVSHQILGRKLNLKTLAKGGFILLTVLIITLITSNNLLTRFSYFTPDDASLSVRLELINQAIYIFKQNTIFGIGGGTFPQYLVGNDFTQSQVSTIFPAPVHSFPLLLISELGIFIFILCAIVICYFFLSFIKRINKFSMSNNFYTIFSVAILASCLTYIFNGLWTLKSIDEHFFMLFWMNLGIYFNLARRSS